MVRLKFHPPRRSGLEDAFEALCKDKGLEVKYEDCVLSFTTPPKKRRYKPDWTIGPNRYIETKGRLDAADRQKLLLVKEQHPEATIYLLFQRAGNTLSKASRTTYGDWATKNGFTWCEFRDTETWMKWFDI